MKFVPKVKKFKKKLKLKKGPCIIKKVDKKRFARKYL